MPHNFRADTGEPTGNLDDMLLTPLTDSAEEEDTTGHDTLTDGDPHAGLSNHEVDPMVLVTQTATHERGMDIRQET